MILKILENFGRIMNVSFRTATGLKTTLSFDPSDTISVVKQKLSEQNGANINHILLFYQSYLLRDDITIEELNLTDDSIIGIRIHKRPIMKLVQEDNENLKSLEQLGFSRENSIAALLSTNDNIEQALDILINQAEQDTTPPPVQPPPKVNEYAAYDDPIERLVAFSGFDRGLVVSVYENFHQDEEEARNYLQQLRE